MGDAAHDLTLDWKWLVLASAIVLATYAMLIQSWRMLLAEWGGHLRYGEAVQIWTIANLGKWIPGKVWQVGALSMMAADAGVSGVAAAGAALLGTALNIGAGLGIAAITSAGGLDAIKPGLRQVAVVLALLFVVGVGALPFVLPTLLDRFARWRGIPLSDRRLSHRTIWVATAINAASWVAYGAAFACFTRGLLPSVSGNPSTFVAVYTASYVLGYLVLFSPGGLGIREAAMIALLVAFGMAGKGDAAILSVASRVWLLVLEVLPGVACLLLLSPLKRAALRRPG
jgi:uncharacterized membrane protein YbhN (UPF0104 family)